MIPRKELKKKEKAHYIDDEVYERFPVKKQAFATVSYKDTGQEGYMGFLVKMKENMAKRMIKGEESRTQEDNALDMGGNALNLLIGNYGFPNNQFLKWEPLVVPELLTKNRFNAPKEKLTDMVKEATFLYGGDLVGITEVDSRWIYSEDLTKPFFIDDSDKPEEREEGFIIPKSVNKAVVIAVAMDADMIQTSPSIPASTTTNIGYSRMAIVAVSLAEYIRGLGYNAIPTMNDTALSIPLAIDAGLGELGRHGLLITPEYGSNIRLCKVLTDMPLIPDKPVDFGVEEFCKRCLLCAEHCPSDSISIDEPKKEGICENNNHGVYKWYIHAEKCLHFWQENGASCANCISVCPFTKGFEWEQCLECVKCDTLTGCELQVNTYLRLKYGYLEDELWGQKPKVISGKRKGL